MIRTIFFDLDGTLLPMDQDVFTKAYFKRLAGKLAPLGYEAQKLVDSIWRGTAAMVKNDGGRSNEEAFWNCFCEIYGEKARQDIPVFEEYYRVEFQNVREVCGVQPAAADLVRALKERGYRLVLATNPLFPAIATESRIRWAGLEPADFERYTTYENSRYCKPNPNYYAELLKELGCAPEETLMVGNDVDEDMVAESLGMKVFLLTDCLINRAGRELEHYPRGGFGELRRYLEI